MKPSDLTYAGPELERLRRDLAHFVGKYNAYQSSYNASLKQMLQDAIDGLVVPVVVEPPQYVGEGMNIGYPSFAAFLGSTNPTYNGTDKLSMLEGDGASFGEWTGEDIVYTYQWYRFNGTDKVDIEGATDVQYVFTETDKGYAIGIKLTGTNSGGSDTADLGWQNFYGPSFGENVVVDPDLVPNAPVSGTATAGDAGELDISLVAGAQITDHPDTSYRVTLNNGSTNQNFTIESATETITGITAGTYDVSVTRVYNDVTGKSVNVSIGSDVVVS